MSKKEQAEIVRLTEALQVIRDIARSELKPDQLTERQYWTMKVRKIAFIAANALDGRSIE